LIMQRPAVVLGGVAGVLSEHCICMAFTSLSLVLCLLRATNKDEALAYDYL